MIESTIFDDENQKGWFDPFCVVYMQKEFGTFRFGEYEKFSTLYFNTGLQIKVKGHDVIDRVLGVRSDGLTSD